MPRRLSLATQILLLQLAIVAVTASVGAAVTLRHSYRQLDAQYGKRVLAIAESVAAMPSIQDAFTDPDPPHTIQPIAEGIRKAAGAEFVVVANRQQIRYSHPDLTKIGGRLSTDASDALAGRTWVGTQTGTLGRSIRAKVPVYDRNGEVIGVVSVGILTDKVSQDVLDTLPQLLLYLALGLVLGVAGSYLLARRVRRQTFGLEPHEIAGLLENREATLHGIREGMVAVDLSRQITMANDEARRLLDLPDDSVGARVDDLGLPGRLRDVLGGAADDRADQIVLRRGRVLVLNRMPVQVRGEDVGAVVTLRDRTELDALMRELDGARSTTDALRAQAHEFRNRMHTVAGLIELAEYDEALSFIVNETREDERFSEEVTARVREPALAALLVAKVAAAAEHGVQLRLAPDTHVQEANGDARDLVTVVGNLVDNAVEALGPQGGWSR